MENVVISQRTGLNHTLRRIKATFYRKDIGNTNSVAQMLLYSGDNTF